MLGHVLWCDHDGTIEVHSACISQMNMIKLDIVPSLSASCLVIGIYVGLDAGHYKIM